MNVVTLLHPPRVVLGNGCAPQCAEHLAQRGVRRVLLVSSTPVLPTLGTVRDALKAANLTVVNATPVDCEPTCALFEQMLVTARTEKIEAVLGIGGGSADNSLRIFGEAGCITVPGTFWEATHAVLSLLDGAPQTIHAPFRFNGFEYEIEEVIRSVRNRRVESPRMPHSATLANLAALDEFRRQLGVRYPFE